MSLMFAASAFGDTITLKSGKVVECTVIEMQEDWVIVRLPSGKKARIRRDAISDLNISTGPRKIPEVEILEESHPPVDGLKGPECFFNGGLSFPSGPSEFSDYWRTGFSLGAGLAVPVHPNVALTAYLDFNRFAFDVDKFSGVYMSGGEVSILTLSGNVKVNLEPRPAPVRPYFSGGMGLFSLSVGDMIVVGPYGWVTVPGDSEAALAILLGGGIDFAIGDRIDLFAEGRYAIGFTEGGNTQMIPVALGIRFR